MAITEQRPEVATIAAVIARSPIVVAPMTVLRRLPEGFEAVDLAILDWIAAEGRRACDSLLRN